MPVTIASKAAEVAAEDNQSLVILITGLVVVFCALLLLIAIIKIYSSIVRAVLGRSKNKASKAKKEPEIALDSKKEVAAAFTSDSDFVDLQTVAVISAAVDAFYGEEKKVRVVSVKRTTAVRSEWANAGMMQNISARRGF